MHNQKVYDIFRTLNTIPRASHHEDRVADFLCKFAFDRGLSYDRDQQNCVVIRKPATKGYEKHEPIVLLNHMDMVAVGDGTRDFDPLNDGIQAYTRNGWMRAKGTSLGADNGIGLSMALAVLDSNDIPHGPLEVLTTSNEEDGMTGAANLSTDFIKGRKVINLDSEDYDTITMGAAGAYLQIATFAPRKHRVTELNIDLTFYCVTIDGGQGGHSGVDINKGRCNAIYQLCKCLNEYKTDNDRTLFLADINGGSANASIPSHCYALIGVWSSDKEEFVSYLEETQETLKSEYKTTDSGISLTCGETPSPLNVWVDDKIIETISSLPHNVIRMREDMPDTVMTSNNIGRIEVTTDGSITVSCHTRSFDDDEMLSVANGITNIFQSNGALVQVVMNTPGWQENKDSDYIKLVSNTFKKTLGFEPRKVAMHFVLEAGYYVQKYPGIEIACIGPRIVEPHSTKERVEIETIDNIWDVLVELLKKI